MELIFEAYEKYYFINITFLYICKNDYYLLSKDPKKNHANNIKNLSDKEKDKRRKKVREKYRNLTKKQKEKGLQYHCERNKVFSKKQKTKLVD